MVFANNICSHNRENHCFCIVVGRALDARRAWGRSPSHELRKILNRAPDTLFPQRSRNSTWWGSSHGAAWCHIPRAIWCHRVAHGCYTLRENLGKAMEIGRAAAHEANHGNFRNNGNLQIPCSRILSATLPQLNFFCHVLACNRK